MIVTSSEILKEFCIEKYQLFLINLFSIHFASISTALDKVQNIRTDINFYTLATHLFHLHRLK